MNLSAEACRKSAIFPLFGIEVICLVEGLASSGTLINDPGNPGKFYICGKGISRFEDMTPRAVELLGVIRRNDAKRMADMTRKLGEVLSERGTDVTLDENDVIESIVARHGSPRETVYIQERHIAQAYQEAVFKAVPEDNRSDVISRILGTKSKAPDDPVTVQNEIRKHLMKAGKSAFVEEAFVTFQEAVELILELGGIPCYPTLADGADPICEFENPVERLIDNIKSRGIHAVEFIPIRNKPDVLTRYVKAMRSAGLVVTAGTEHNTRDLLAIEPRCVGQSKVPDEIQRIFSEGACVVAAHEYLVSNGLCGFVDDAGVPNPAYKNAEKRIEAFHKIGAEVIRRYLELRTEK